MRAASASRRMQGVSLASSPAVRRIASDRVRALGISLARGLRRSGSPHSEAGNPASLAPPACHSTDWRALFLFTSGTFRVVNGDGQSLLAGCRRCGIPAAPRPPGTGVSGLGQDEWDEEQVTDCGGEQEGGREEEQLQAKSTRKSRRCHLAAGPKSGCSLGFPATQPKTHPKTHPATHFLPLESRPEDRQDGRFLIVVRMRG